MPARLQKVRLESFSILICFLVQLLKVCIYPLLCIFQCKQIWFGEWFLLQDFSGYAVYKFFVPAIVIQEFCVFCLQDVHTFVHRCFSTNLQCFQELFYAHTTHQCAILPTTVGTINRITAISAQMMICNILCLLLILYLLF